MTTPQTRVQFDDGPGGDEAEEERTEIVELITALECFVKLAANILERELHTVSPSAIEALMPKRLVGSGMPLIQSSVSELQLPLESK
ncbi:MAG: hypothetical protein ACKPKO_16205, partial [Candidatus Fonsibacter sp.]